ncbi:MAG: 4Fe-4S dicluster domain-containing protein [Chloroflexi bacterium]|nr:4Fe-4S dicluster domain-containing protein [Chloroflexota bacterium]
MADWEWLYASSVTLGLGILVALLVAAIVSLQEGERRAARRLVGLAIALAAPYWIVGLFDLPYRAVLAAVLLALAVLISLILLAPTGAQSLAADDTPSRRIDERDIMFSRYRLEIGSEHFDDYYRRNPGKKESDDKFRAKPGLLRRGASFHDPVLFAAAEASFSAVAAFHPLLDRDFAGAALLHAPTEQMTRFVKRWAKKLGAFSVGIAELKAYHLYSHIGRGARYGEPVELAHQSAVALTVEMDKASLDYAPLGPTVMESAQQYLAVGAIAVQLAEFIRGLGYSARAHIDGSYRVVCPLVARDAGLGEIGRMGLLMTPAIGPRVRLAVVTTDLPLAPDSRRADAALIDFCTHCKKCAEVCPSRAIPFDDRKERDGVKRWQINSEACFAFWCAVGTDCGRCLRVCPYSHPDNWLHNVVRSGVKNSARFRAVALAMDDFLYGRRPAPRSLPEWLRVTETAHARERHSPHTTA